MSDPQSNFAAPFLRLDYEALAGDYEHRLETMERGFGMDAEFLNVWVPDADHNKGLFYLFEAAALGGLPGLTVVIRSGLLQAIDGDGLLHQLKSLGTVNVARAANQVEVRVAFNGHAGGDTNLDEIPGLSSLHSAYRDRLVRETRELTHRLHEQSASHEVGPQQTCLRADFAGGTVEAVVNMQSHVVESIQYTGQPDCMTARLLEVFCRLAEGFPLQEVAEHGAIRLENHLRDPQRPPPVRGLITPTNAGADFRALNNLARDLFQRYRAQCGIAPARNCSEYMISTDWLGMSPAERLDAVRCAAAAIPSDLLGGDTKLEILDILNLTQVFVSLDGPLAEREKRAFIRDLERHLKNTVEARLEVYLPTAEDRLKRHEKSDLVDLARIQRSTLTTPLKERPR